MMKTKLFKQSGQALVIIAIAAIGLFGIVGLAVDGSAKFSDRRHAQNAADTAALSAALVKANGLAAVPPQIDSICKTPVEPTTSSFCLDIIYAAWDRATENGYDGLLPDSVDVYSPPISGPYINNTSYVQVIITSYTNTYFARVLGIRQTKNTVEAVAYLYEGGDLADGAMLIAYDPAPSCSNGVGAGGGSVDVIGNTTVNLNGGGIFVNSNQTCGFTIPNCANLNISTGSGISSAVVSPTDNINQDGCATQAPEFPNHEQVIIPDDVHWPDVPPECSINPPPAPVKLGIAPDGQEEWLISPGYYEDFPQASLVTNKSHVYMKSGIYCIDPGGPSHDFDLSWSPVDFVSLNGSTDPLKNKYQDPGNALPDVNPKGVTLYIKSGGGFSINANNPTYLDATTDPSSDYQGYLIILEGQHTSIENCSISGGATIDINGMIYAPYCDITVNGGSTSTAVINAQLIGWHLKIDGKSGINFKYNPSNQVKIKRKIGLMR
jgi:hypothetical protein